VTKMIQSMENAKIIAKTKNSPFLSPMFLVTKPNRRARTNHRPSPPSQARQDPKNDAPFNLPASLTSNGQPAYGTSRSTSRAPSSTSNFITIQSTFSTSTMTVNSTHSCDYPLELNQNSPSSCSACSMPS
jgi:hypothetical protein